jgi:ATP-binding cassette subfamily B multidrug efflux pump
MAKLVKFLKPFTFLIVFIFGLLLVQASLDLALPDFTSKIVNVGIQQNGIEKSIPEVITQTSFNDMSFFLSKEDTRLLKSCYTLIDVKNASKKQKEMYPLISKSKLMILDKSKDEIYTPLELSVSKALLAMGGIEMERQRINKGLEGVDSALQSAELRNIELNLEKTKIQMREKFKAMPEAIIKQGAISVIKVEYSKIGVDTNSIQMKYILMSGGLMLLIAISSMAVSIAVGYFASRVASGLGFNLRQDVFSKVTNFSGYEVDKFSIPSLITRTTNDIQQIQMSMVMTIRIIFYAPVLAAGGVIKVLTSNSSMGWVIAVGVMSILSVVILVFSIAMPKFKIIQKLIDRLNLVAREALSGMLVIRAFSTQKHEEKRFDVANNDITKVNLFIARIMSGLMPIMMFLMNAITILIVWVGSNNINDGTMQVGDMMAFIQYTMQIIMSFLMISMLSVMLPRSLVCVARIDEVLSSDTSIKDVEKPAHFLNSKRGLIEFRDVSFGYPHAEECVLRNISFTAEPNQTTAFIGSTGSGKSTLIKLIPRFYDVSKGKILVDGVDIRKVSQNELREKIGYVPQTGILFSGTIKSNLAFGNKYASERQLMQVSDIAQARDFIKEKDEGLGFEISQGGTNVSGGQKQRLSIARALAKNAEIYIFDDSFSALDFRTDAKLRKALSQNVKNATVLIVAQRISTILNADKIVVLDEGEMVGMGTHKELMQNCEVYRQIAFSQLSKEELGYE